mgnify:CR=1 FL=1
MANIGVAPPDFSTEVGQFRALVGDTSYVATNPGFGDYKMFSDAEIQAFLAQGGGSEFRAAGYAFLALSGQAALQSKSVKTDDLSIDLKNQAEALRKTAEFWFQRADEEDAAAGLDDEFLIVPTGQGRSCRCAPELAARPVCGCWND